LKERRVILIKLNASR